MFRMSGSIQREGRTLRSCVSRQEDESLSRTRHVIEALREISEHLDLPVPIWLSKNIREFQRKSRTDFRQDSFLEHIPFDVLHIEVIEE